MTVLFIWVVFVKLVETSITCRIPLDIFIYLAAYAAIPMSHWIWLQGGPGTDLAQDKLRQIIWPFVAGGVGLGFYVSRVPEKMLRAKSVDIVGASHQVSF